MRLVIAGGRNRSLSFSDIQKLNALLAEVNEVITGEGGKTDASGKVWAKSLNLPYTGFPARWHDLSEPDAIIKTRIDGIQFDAYAGPRRNRQMAAYAARACDGGMLAAFPGGEGTADMVKAAAEAGLLIFDYRKGSR